MREDFVYPSGFGWGEEVFLLWWVFPLPCEGIGRALACCEDGARQTRAARCAIPPISSSAGLCFHMKIDKSNNTKFPLPGLFGKVPFLTITNAPAI